MGCKHTEQTCGCAGLLPGLLMIEINIKADVARLSRELDVLQEGLTEKATVMALNKTGDKARTEMGRAITSEFNIKAADVRARLRVIKARRGELRAVLDPFASGHRGRSMNLIRFMENKVTLAEGRRRKKAGTQKQLRFKIKKGGPAKAIPGAFIGNKGRTVFMREGDGRLPIKAASTIGVPSMFNTRHINARVIARIRKEFPIEFERAAAQVVRRFNG